MFRLSSGPWKRQIFVASLKNHLHASRPSQARSSLLALHKINKHVSLQESGPHKPDMCSVAYLHTSRVSYASDEKPQSRGPGREIADEADKVTLKQSPETVSMTSSVRPIFEDGQAPPPDSNPDMTAGIRQDLNMVKETFALRDVPKEVTLLGLAGLIPYVATSSTTLFLAWDVKNIHHYGTGYLFDESQATALLNFLEPIQVGYGAIILGFLGAIHWGLEFAKFGGSSPYTRYILGIAPAAFAWPTVFMPYDYALLAQFLGFVSMYFADAQITVRGWAPKWYTTYRFILTFVVGASIVATLIGRGKIGDKVTEVSSPVGRVIKLRSTQRIGLEEESSSTKYQQKLREEEALIRANREARKKQEQEAGKGGVKDDGKRENKQDEQKEANSDGSQDTKQSEGGEADGGANESQEKSKEDNKAEQQLDKDEPQETSDEQEGGESNDSNESDQETDSGDAKNSKSASKDGKGDSKDDKSKSKDDKSKSKDNSKTAKKENKEESGEDNDKEDDGKSKSKDNSKTAKKENKEESGEDNDKEDNENGSKADEDDSSKGNEESSDEGGKTSKQNKPEGGSDSDQEESKNSKKAEPADKLPEEKKKSGSKA